MKPLSPFGLPIGVTMAVWSFIGILRFFHEKYLFKFFRKSSYELKNDDKKVLFEEPSTDSIACVLAAHNEELIIKRTIKSLKQTFKASQIYVASDGSTDKTTSRARSEKVHVVNLKNGLGKASALIYLIRRFKLYSKYRFIFIIDADTQLDKGFIPGALKMFQDPEIKTVYAAPHIYWPDHIIPRTRYILIAYRERLNQILRYMMQYGQTWKKTNVTYVIPGYCTIYRTETLKKIPFDTPGLLIEDFNTAFYFHKHKMGKVGFSPHLIAWDQHPDNLGDYWRQVARWNIGFFQTVRINGFWPSWFWLTLGIFTVEVFIQSLFLLLLPVTLLFLLLPAYGIIFPNQEVVRSYLALPFLNNVTLLDVYVWVFIFDYLLSIAIGWMIRKPQFAVYGLFFIVVHIITALILVYSLLPGFFSKSRGIWSSPRRHTHGMESVKI